MREVLRHWVVFAAVLGVTVLPALLGLTVLPQLTEWPRFFTAVWTWQIMAMVPAGFARVDFDGQIWLADSAWLLALLLWALLGLVCSVALHRVRLLPFAAVALPLILAAGIALHLVLQLFGIAAYAGV